MYEIFSIECFKNIRMVCEQEARTNFLKGLKKKTFFEGLVEKGRSYRKNDALIQIVTCSFFQFPISLFFFY